MFVNLIRYIIRIMIHRFVAIIACILLLSTPYQTVNASSDKAFTTLRLNKFGSVVIVIGTKFGFDIGGLITPFFTKLGDIAVPDFKPTADWLSGAKGFITPQQYEEDGKHINWSAALNPIFYTALYGAILKTEAPHGTKEISPECVISKGNEKSDDLPQDANDNFQRAREYDGWFGINPVDPDDSGIIDFNLPPLQLGGMNAAEDCKKHQAGFEQPPVEHDIRQFSQFGGAGTKIEGHELETIMKIVEFFNQLTGETELREEPETEMHKDDVILTKDVKQPYHSIQCHHGGCPGNEAGEYSGKAAETGGWTAFLLREEDKKPFVPASIQQYKIKIVGFDQKPGDFSYDLKNLSDRRTEQAACYVVPDTTNTTQGDAQAKAAIGGNKDRRIDPMCKPPPPGQCPIDLIEQGAVSGDASCGLCNTNAYVSSDTYLTPFEKGALPGGIPPLMQKVLEAAGSTYNVPASVLLATMLEEGSFDHPDTWQWTDDTVRQWSDCTVKDPLPSCEEFAHPSTGAKGPFGFIQNWWDQFMESGGPYKAFENDPAWKETLANMTKENITQCNFVDAAFNSARELGEDSSHYQPQFVPPAPLTCAVNGTTYNMSIPTLPASCASWDTARTVLARLQYGDRICEDPGVARVARTFDTMSCGGGRVSF